MKTVYHIYLDTDEHGYPVPVILNKEPTHYDSMQEIETTTHHLYLYHWTQNDFYTAYEIGRAIERKARGD